MLNMKNCKKQKNEIDISIIIVSWNTKDCLRNCLNLIYDTIHEFKFEVIVIDNGSRDGSPLMVEKDFPQAMLIQSGSNLGFSGANNIGIEKSRGRYFALINSDIEVMEGCIDSLCAFMDKKFKVGIVGPRILNPDMSIQPSCYGYPTYWNSLIHALGINKLNLKTILRTSIYEKYIKCEKTQSVDILSGCFWIIRKETLDEVGLLDDNFFFGWEDFDLCKRFHLVGWDVVYIVEAVAIHYGQRSSLIDPTRFIIESEKGHIQFWRKYHGNLGVIFITFVILIRHILQYIKNTILFLIKPSQRKTIKIQLKKNYALLHWFLFPCKNNKIETL